MDHFTIPAWVAKAVYAIAIAAILGSGNAILQTTKEVAVLNAEKDALVEKDEALERTLTQRLDRMEGKIDVLIEKGHSHP